MLTEARYLDLYRQSRHLADEGAHGAAREILFHLFDRGRDAGGYGVTRLTFVLRDLADLAQAGQSERGKEEARALEGLTERRDAREAKATAGEAAFVEFQELIALNRVLGDKERSFALYRKLRKNDDTADGAKTLGDLLREDLVPRDPLQIALEIERQRLGEHLSHFIVLTRRLAEPVVKKAGGATDPQDQARRMELRHELRRAAGRAREVASRLRDGARLDKKANLSSSASGSGDRAKGTDSLVTGVVKLTDPRRLKPALDRGEEARPRLQGLAREAEALLHNADLSGQLSDDLHRRVLEMASEVAENISAIRVRQDFGDNGAENKTQQSLEEYAERRVRQDGLLVYEVLLRLNETAAAERMAAWLLAYRQDEDMYLELIHAARRANQPLVEEELNEEAQRVLLAG